MGSERLKKNERRRELAAEFCSPFALSDSCLFIPKFDVQQIRQSKNIDPTARKHRQISQQTDPFLGSKSDEIYDVHHR